MVQVKLAEPVMAVGNIEDWLKKMVAGMQDTIKKIIRKSWEEVNSLPVEKFIFSYPAQVRALALFSVGPRYIEPKALITQIWVLLYFSWIEDGM
jgi:hypothetical protein